MKIFNINLESTHLLQMQVVGILSGLIDDKEFQNGKLLLNEMDIGKRMGISRNRVSQTINKLAMEQLENAKMAYYAADRFTHAIRYRIRLN